MDIWHWWFAKLAVVQLVYLFAVIWGMRYLQRQQNRLSGVIFVRSARRRRVQPRPAVSHPLQQP